MKERRIRGFSLHIVPFSEIRDLSIGERIAEKGEPGEEVCIMITSVVWFFNLFRSSSFCAADFPPTTNLFVDVTNQRYFP